MSVFDFSTGENDRLFYSRRLGAAVPVFGAYADRVREMLREYVALSGGKVRLEMLDPEPFSETEDRALGLGLQAAPLDNEGEQVYFGLAGSNLLDAHKDEVFNKFTTIEDQIDGEHPDGDYPQSIYDDDPDEPIEDEPAIDDEEVS